MTPAFSTPNERKNISASPVGVAADGRGAVFVFPGQGSQWAAMAEDLLSTSAVFARHIRACENALAPHLDWSLTDVLTRRPGAPALDRVDVVQPALFAMMVSLARLWEQAGVHPHAVIGHSQGEIAAAHIAGALSLGDAATVVALRSQAIASIGTTGRMASVPLRADEVRRRLAGWGDRLNVGAVNGPAVTVVSGEVTALTEFVASCRAEDLDVREVRVDYASHSPLVEPVKPRLLDVLSDIRPRASDIVFYSTVTGRRLDTARLTAGYWYRNLRQTVELGDAVRAAVADGHRVFVESSPHVILTEGVQAFARDALGEPTEVVVVTGTLRRDHGGIQEFRASLARVRGGSVET
ncbi:acyltransferase domain-containing protein [Planotetraspora kaengkrachanensis]|uniref:Malonyl-CoA:ACP transacylase (MAT) domain-containing protein n=1 Tax=Planotetraspora kaengkrachanensis TaxID=575193 RepID=A0A8J3LY73_9ACTN|nr:acyltransferase domain-containing protein [Planotetraspora kaengkrachanensis]GIG78598.1 hypothetical protein Pka01_17250 [Planotetraspora kaengkrachanensis]